MVDCSLVSMSSLVALKTSHLDSTCPFDTYRPFELDIASLVCAELYLKMYSRTAQE